MLYSANGDAKLRDEVFKNPGSAYRGTPFWAWDGKLDREEMARQIKIFKQMGLGGFHMHVRTGMDTPYLSREFMDYIRFCTENAREEGMLAWLYDEDRWPSGSAGGRVTDGRPEFARKCLLLTTEPYTPDRPHKNTKPEPGRGQNSIRQDNGELLAVYDVTLNADGTLCSFKRIGEADEAQGAKWYAYMEHATEDPWFNNHAYVDTLKKDAIAKFISLTHEEYYKTVGDEFGKLVPAIFTDEPQFCPRNSLAFAAEQKDVFMAWTDELLQKYADKYNENLLDRLPELLWELPGGRLSSARWRYQNLITEMFVESFCVQVGSWCRAHGLRLTGHVMGEPTLMSQSRAVGDAMRCYRYFDIPGIDMLCDYHEYTTAKQCQSIVRQTGKEGMLSELYGVTGWDYDFRGYKLQGDWQAALGVTVRVPHLAWMTMKGEAKRDYPASISYQSPWWDQFSMVEDHFARLNTALTRGKAAVRVAVVHPIESYWLHWGPSDQTAAERDRMEHQFDELCRTLLFGGIDFDYIDEAELPALCEKGGCPLKVGEMKYDAVLVPGVDTLRSSTLNRLNDFMSEGGRLIFLGGCPAYVDAESSDAAKEIYDRAEHLAYDPTGILAALEPYRFADIRRSDGSREDGLLMQLRSDGDDMWLFVCNGKNPVSPDVDDARKLRFTLKGEFAITLYDTLSGDIRRLPASCIGGNTVFEKPWHIHDSLLLRLEKGRGEALGSDENRAFERTDMVLSEVDVKLEEPNMLLLDMAEYAFDEGEMQPIDELLRIDNAARRRLGIPVRRKEVVQPYLLEPEKPLHSLRLRFTIPSEIDLADARLALETPEDSRVVLNGEQVPYVDAGWFVDKSIRVMALPPIHRGVNTLEITVPIAKRTNLECFYILGDFGVRINGITKTIIPPVRRLGFGDIVPQGLPFYTGNLVYRFTVRSQGDFALRVPRYRGGLVKVFVDGRDAGNIAFSPYILNVKAEEGEHTVEIRLYGTRFNGFAQLHHTPGVYFYQSPNSWRSADDLWCYEYQLKPAGILKSPELMGAVAGDRKTALSASEHMTDLS